MATALLALLLPLMMGGCPNLSEEVFSTVETTIRGLINAGLDDAFANIRGDNNP